MSKRRRIDSLGSRSRRNRKAASMQRSGKCVPIVSRSQVSLVLLDHKFRRLFCDSGRMQHWHRSSVAAIATARKRRIVAIELGTWRCGRIGGAAGSVTTGKRKFLDCRGATWCRGGDSLPFGDQETVGRDRQRAVMVEAPPGAALVMADADLLLEFLIVALDAPTQLGQIDQGGKRHVAVDVREP